MKYQRTVNVVASAEYVWLNVPMHITQAMECLNAQNCMSQTPQRILVIKVVSENPIEGVDAARGYVDKIKVLFEASLEPV
jgi:hypothetical protein